MDYYYHPLSSLTLNIIMVCILRVMASNPASDTLTMRVETWGGGGINVAGLSISHPRRKWLIFTSKN